MLNDYEKLMQYLVTEEYEKAIEYRTEHKSGAADFDNVTRLEKIKEIWENVISPVYNTQLRTHDTRICI